jgi:hypothetical protein
MRNTLNAASAVFVVVETRPTVALVATREGGIEIVAFIK